MNQYNHIHPKIPPYIGLKVYKFKEVEFYVRGQLGLKKHKHGKLWKKIRPEVSKLVFCLLIIQNEATHRVKTG